MKLFFLTFFLSTILLAECSIGTPKSKCNLSDFSKIEDVKRTDFPNGESYKKQSENKLENIVFNNNILVLKTEAYNINDITDYNNNDIRDHKEVSTILGTITSMGKNMYQFESAKEALAFLNNKIDYIKMDSGKVVIMNSFVSSNSVISKIATCEYNVKKSTCVACNYINGSEAGDTMCLIEKTERIKGE
jgi:hypothetical protein